MKRDEYIYKRFYDDIMRLDNISENIDKHLMSNEFVRGLFDVCEKVSYIGINAPKFKSPNSGDVSASFQYADVDNAISYIIDFTKEYQDIETSELLSIVGKLHGCVLGNNDTGNSSGIMWNDDHSLGSYYNFAELPKDIWLSFRKYAEECICTGKSPDSAHSTVFNAE